MFSSPPCLHCFKMPSYFIFCSRYLHCPIDPDAPSMTLQSKPVHHYQTLGCVFNHKIFLANCQVSDAVELCVFDFTDGSRWKAMSEEAVRSVCDPGFNTSLPPTPPLCSPSLVPNEASNQLELEIRYLLSEHRKVTTTQVHNKSLTLNLHIVHFEIQFTLLNLS